MPFTHSLSPVIFSLGPFALRWYSLVYVLGFLLAYWLLRQIAKEGRIKNLDEEGVEEFVTWLILCSIIMARLTYVIVYNPAYFLATPWKVIAVWEGGLSFHGGFLGAILAGLWFCRKRKVRFYDLGDFLVVPFSLILVFGRLANFVNGELPGRVTSVPWCINYSRYEGCRHPSQFYEAGKNLLLFFVLLALYAKEEWRKKLKAGSIFWLFIILYGLGRFLTDFWRAPDPTDFTLASTGLLVGQWLSLAMGLTGVSVLAWLYRQRFFNATKK